MSECINEKRIDKMEIAVEGNGKPGLKADMAVVKMTNKIILAMNSAILIAMVKILFFGS